ncbi:DMT family transporter [bacterium]|nr:DMT family transporter [bacterium]
MPFWGETWSLMCALLWASATILFRVAVRGIPAIELALFKNSFAAILFFLTWLAFPDLDAQGELSSRDILILIVSGMLGIGVGDTLFLYSLRILGAGRNTILTCLFSPFVILLSFLFLQERIGILQLVGILIILTGILLATYQKPQNAISKDQLIRGTLIGITAVFFMAVGMVSTKPILNDASPVTVSCIRLLGGTAGIVIFTVFTGRIFHSIQVFKGHLPWKVMLIGAFVGSYLALFAWIVGFKHTSASVASILNQTSVFFTLLLAAFFLKERLSLLKVAGAILGSFGVLLIILNA